MANPDGVDWDAIIRDSRFQSLHRRKSLFLWGLMALSVVYYFLLPVGAAYYQDLFKIRVWGVVNVGLLFALSEFVVAWAIALIYSRKASQEFDRMAREIAAEFGSGKPRQRKPTYESTSRKRFMVALLAAVPLLATPAFAQAGVPEGYRWLTFRCSPRSSRSRCTSRISRPSASGRRRTSTPPAAALSGLQNGWAIAGDYLSAASFLGIAGLISLYGYDGFMYSVGWLVAYITVLLVIAEPCRNIGKYTLSDILAYRNDPKKTRIVGALSTITVSTFYLTAQMVGGGVLVKTLIGIDYEISVIAVGILMLGYVLFGGMVATTWVQIIKAVLLVGRVDRARRCSSGRPTASPCPAFLADVVATRRSRRRSRRCWAMPAKNMTAAELGQRFLEPGLYFKAPIDQISLGMALVFGTAGMPHILMRFFTVPTAQQARQSVIWAMAIIGGFYVLTLFLGFGAAHARGPRQHRGGRCGRQHGRPAARAVHRRRAEFDSSATSSSPSSPRSPSPPSSRWSPASCWRPPRRWRTTCTSA